VDPAWHLEPLVLATVSKLWIDNQVRQEGSSPKHQTETNPDKKQTEQSQLYRGQTKINQIRAHQTKSNQIKPN
jgi:hypothetical protein